MRIEEKKKVRVGKVKKDKSGEDWIVPVYVDGKFNDDMTYYAGNGKEAKKDAEGTRDQIIKDMRNSKEYELEEEIMKEENIIELKDDIVIRQDDRKIILEKGDRVQVLKEASKNIIVYPVKRSKPIPQKDYDEFYNRTFNGPMIHPNVDIELPKPWDAYFYINKTELVIDGGAGPSGWGSCIVKVPLPNSKRDADYFFVLEPNSQEDSDWIIQKLESLGYELEY